MRFREIELVRYGGFADRLLDLGKGGPDLHLVIGPNEAGKSTMLQAIGDFLFGIGGQTTQGWRWGYGDLRIRAVLDQEGRLIEAVRRKGNKDTLLALDGTPIPGDPLGPVLAGVDRAAFERMFGLDHQRLREGGEAILRGRDDAARITLEAGTGVAGIGREMDRFSTLAAELFKSGGSVPLVNKLMRERVEAQKLVRESAISETKWADYRRRRNEAEERRLRLIEEAGELEREAARLDRVGRARGPLARLARARAKIAELGPVRDLPPNASERLPLARSERRIATELLTGHRDDLLRLNEAAAALTPSPDLLAVADRVEALDRRRPVIEKAEGDLQRRVAEWDRADERISTARRDAKLAADAPSPGQGWRRRAAAHLQERREAAVAARATASRRAELQRDRDDLVAERTELADVVGGPELGYAIAALPTDWISRLKQVETEAARKRNRADAALRALAPWTGDAAALAGLAVPGLAEAIAVARSMDEARADALAARREADVHATDAVRAETRIAALAAAGDLPTAEAVAVVRATRDELLQLVVGGDLDRADALRVAVERADQLADRRDAEAERVAEYAGTMQARDGARELEQGARLRQSGREAELKTLEDAWLTRLQALGFARPVGPGDIPAWLDSRTRAIEAEDEAAEAREVAETLHFEFDRARTALRFALSACGAEPPAGEEGLIVAAQTHERMSAEASVTRARLDAELVEAGRAIAVAHREAEQERTDAAIRDKTLHALLAEAGLDDGGEADLSDVLAAIETASEDVVARAGLERQIEGMRRDATEFDAELSELLRMLGRNHADVPTRTVAGLAAELRVATTARDKLAELKTERARLAHEAERAGRRREEAQRELDDLMRRAEAIGEEELERAVEAANRRRALLDTVVGTEEELAALDDGGGIEALESAVLALPPDEEAVARRRIEDRREALASEREEVGRALAEADEFQKRASWETAAADAQQAVAVSDAALAAAAESHIEAATAGALLRWVLDRHRQVNQAPLISSAGALFATVTDGAFSGLRVDYGDDDRPTIRAVRADGGSIGVEALSEGTRDQLYLALRLGSISTGAHALPVVCDDLLVTADDARAGAMLRVLAAASTRSQIILFTHHQHLVDVARQSIGNDGFTLHTLEPSRVAAA